MIMSYHYLSHYIAQDYLVQFDVFLHIVFIHNYIFINLVCLVFLYTSFHFQW